MQCEYCEDKRLIAPKKEPKIPTDLQAKQSTSQDSQESVSVSIRHDVSEKPQAFDMVCDFSMMLKGNIHHIVQRNSFPNSPTFHFYRVDVTHTKRRRREKILFRSRKERTSLSERM
jgi:hypothetical protein